MRIMPVVFVAWAAACAPSVDDPASAQRAVDRDDEARLAHQLAELPTVTSASVTVHRPARDPLAPGVAVPASESILIVTEAAADRAHVTASARTLARAAIPEVADPAIVVEPGAPRPVLASVGPFTVEAGSRGLLRTTLALALVAIAALAAAVAYYRRGTSTQ